MGVVVRTYATLDVVEPGERFFARAIAQAPARKGRPGGFTEGFSVGFYGETQDEAFNKAHAWIEAERVRQIEIGGNRAAAAEKNRAHAAAKRSAA